ncbi:hypothetical protein TNCV_1315691 [Trichonephila clavipes]|uniref:Uncharacterized protein n=1 Tax=Trichonephila clavipes TaxID=2585209 RepID=A0A8X6SMX8_TRICX|nr:hypothetical protein TNCV_1315691 [Trichonephila clavipes]
MALETLAQASVMRFRSSCSVDGGVRNSLFDVTPHYMESNGFSISNVIQQRGIDLFIAHSITRKTCLIRPYDVGDQGCSRV